MRQSEGRTAGALHRRVTRGDGQRGALSLFVAIIFTGMVLVIGLVVDASGRLDAGVDADEYANEAARAGIQRINTADAVTGASIQVNCDRTTGAPAAVAAYLSGVTFDDKPLKGSVQRCTATTVAVTVQTSYPTKLLSIIGIDSFPITASGTATLTGQQQPNPEQP
jgi:Flp pilus assembly protein TadG